MRYSKQRELILEVVNQSSDHPTAEMIYWEVKKQIPNISLGTVYRNLNALVDASLIKRIHIQDVDHFDHRKKEHYHFCCRECQTLYDLEATDMKKLIQKVEEKEQVKIDDYEILFYGTGMHCMKKGLREWN